MARIILVLNDEERAALITLAENEFRDPRAQAALIIHKELERHGLLAPPGPQAPAAPSAADTTPTQKLD